MAPTGQSPHADDTLLQRPIFIVGAPRSGTTLLAGLLRRHRHVAYVGEPRLIWRYGNDEKSDVLYAADARPDVRAYIRRRFASEVRRQGKQRLLEKGPDNSLRMEFIDAVMPDGIFIHTMRNGIDAILSIRNHWLLGMTPRQPVRWSKRFREMHIRQLPHYASEIVRRAVPRWLRRSKVPPVWGPWIPGLREMRGEIDLLDICCMQWRMCVELACQYGRSLPSHRYMETQLEEFSLSRLLQLLHFVGLDEDPAVLQRFKERFKPEAAAAGANAMKATAEERRQILRWIEPTEAWLGRPTPPA